MSAAETIPCDHVIAQLWEYIDGEISDERARLIRAHLDVCAHCFPQWDFQRAFLSFLRLHSKAPIPPAVRQRIFESLLREDATPGSSSNNISET